MKYALLAGVFLCTPSPTAGDSLCGGVKARESMANLLYAEQEDFRDWVCEGACTREDFGKRIEYHEETVRERPKAVGCFVEPVEKTSNSATGVFVLAGSRPALQFVFHGVGIGPSPDREVARGFRVLVGTERQDASTFLHHYYTWNGRSYALRNTRNASDAPAK
jgi:hypothetical protein